MRCPPEIADALLRILRTGILRIRAFGWSNRPDRCAVEADHIHNLPDLLEDYSPEKLEYYWSVERPGFLDLLPEDEHAEWELVWHQLRPHVEALRLSAPSR